eukprot:m51a1_g977 hypothetical protein (235) ;mRNA; f:406115-407226
MGDLLGSILSSMSETLKARGAKPLIEDPAKKAAEELRKFREAIEQKVASFLTNYDAKKIEFEEMPKTRRLIISEVCESHGLVCHSFGDDRDYRVTIAWKSDAAPTEDELIAIKIEHDPSAAAHYARVKFLKEQAQNPQALAEQQRLQEEAQQARAEQRRSRKTAHTAAKGASDVQRLAVGEVVSLSQHKRDRRTVHQVQLEHAEARKRKRLEDGSSAPAAPEGDDDDAPDAPDA